MGTPSGTGTAPAQADQDQVDPALWRTASALIVGALAMVFDTTIVSVALNDLTRELDASIGTVQWVSTGYLLAMFVSLPLTGWAQARLGGKRLWLLSLGVFLLGSVLCTMAWDAPSLIAFRVVQGLGGGVMMPLMITLIMQAAKGRKIGKVMATISLPAALGPILGPVFGGIILNLGNWRWMFLINIPFCVVGALLAWRCLTDDRPSPDKPRTRLDAVGLSLLTPGVVAVIFALSQFDASTGFTAPQVLLPLLAGLVLIAVFALWGLRRGADAVVDVRLFRHRSLTSASALGFLAGLTLYGAMLLLPLYWQQVRGEDALGAALLLIPQGVGALASRNLAGRFMDRLGPRAVALAGFTTVTLATIPFALAGADTGNTWLMAALLVRGLGMGACTIPLTGAAYVGLSHQEIPHASILTRVTQQIGGSLGTAALAMILQHATAGVHTRNALAAGYDHTFWWSVAFSALATPLCLLLPGQAAPARKPASDDA